METFQELESGDAVSRSECHQKNKLRFHVN